MVSPTADLPTTPGHHAARRVRTRIGRSLPARRRPSRRGTLGLVLGVLAVWLTLYLLAAWPAPLLGNLDSNFYNDSAVFVEAGALLLGGGRPYVSYWDHKPPLVHLLNAAGLALGGGRVWGVWLLGLAALLGSLALAARTLGRGALRTGAPLALVYFAFTLPAVHGANVTEQYALPLEWAAALAVVGWGTAERHLLRQGLAQGALGGALFMLRANLIGAPLAACLALALALLAEGRGRAVLRLAAGALLGAGVVVGGVVAYVAAKGALVPFWDQVFRYNFLYISTTWPLRLRAAYAGLHLMAQNGTLLLPLAGWALALSRMRRGRRVWGRRAWLVLLVVWPPLELALAATSGREYVHYFMPLLAPFTCLVALAAADGVRVLRRAWRGPRTPRLVTVGGVVAVALAVLPVADLLLHVRDHGLPNRWGPQLAAAARYVRVHTRTDDPILVWGHSAALYYYADRRPASRFIYMLPLLTPRYADSTVVAAFVAEVRHAAPPLIIDATADKLVPPLARWSPTWRYPKYGGQRWAETTPALKRFYDFVAASYVPIATVGHARWVVYSRRDMVAPGVVPIVVPSDTARSGDADDTLSGDVR